MDEPIAMPSEPGPSSTAASPPSPSSPSSSSAPASPSTARPPHQNLESHAVASLGHGHSHVHYRPPWRGHGHSHHFGHGHSHGPPLHRPPPARPDHPPPPPRRAATRPMPSNTQQQRPNGASGGPLGQVRDRLFHAMLVRMALGYCSKVPRRVRRLIEFALLMLAVTLFASLILVHSVFSKYSTTCLDEVKDSWPRDGVLRLEIVRNLDVLRAKEVAMQQFRAAWEEQHEEPPPACHFDPAEIFRYGPQMIPAEIRQRGYLARNEKKEEEDEKKGRSLLRVILSTLADAFFTFKTDHILGLEEDEEGEENQEWLDSMSGMEGGVEQAMAEYEREFDDKLPPDLVPSYVYRVEFSLVYGLLRLPEDYLVSHNIPILKHQVDSTNSCLGTPLALFLMDQVTGFDDPILTSLRTLGVNQSAIGDIGYIRDLRSNDHYHFVPGGTSHFSYFTALLVMCIFTFAISLLLRFSHHQIFLFIVDLLHMFEHNQPLAFPAAPLLTVILALVGMEAIMSEIFSDTSTAFYVILIVWVADQFDAICCRSQTSKRFWLRFFYMYQYFFYAYQYRFGGQYGGLALATSSAFILHSMIFFFHHYEIPFILYNDRLERIMSELNHQQQPVVQEIDLGGQGGVEGGREEGAPFARPVLPPSVRRGFGRAQMAVALEANYVNNIRHSPSPSRSMRVLREVSRMLIAFVNRISALFESDGMRMFLWGRRPEEAMVVVEGEEETEAADLGPPPVPPSTMEGTPAPTPANSDSGDEESSESTDSSDSSPPPPAVTAIVEIAL